MKNNKNLANAAIVGENSEAVFLIQDGLLHAVDKQVAALKKDKDHSKQLVTMLQDALQEIIKFAEGKIPPHFIDLAQQALAEKQNEQAELTHKIEQIYTHLPHHDRIQLSSMIHHSQMARIK